MSNGILIKISEDLFIKSDKCSFFICIDKGDTKFPGGVISRYYKPVSWHNAISEIENSVKRNEYKITEETIDFINNEKEFFSWIDINNFKINNVEMNDFSIEQDSSNYILKEKHKTICYPSTFKNALKSLYIHVIRNSDFDNFTKISETMKEIKSITK